MGLETYRSLDFVTLYALSTAVLYTTNTWRRVNTDGQDYRLAVVRTQFAVYERHLPQTFLEQITDTRISAAQLGSLPVISGGRTRTALPTHGMSRRRALSRSTIGTDRRLARLDRSAMRPVSSYPA